MIPIGNIGSHPLSVGIATLNRRLNIDDALRASLPSVRAASSSPYCYALVTNAKKSICHL